GEDGRVANAIPMIPAPTRDQQMALATQQRELTLLDEKIGHVRKAWHWRDGARPQVEAILRRVAHEAEADPGVSLLPEENQFDGRNVFGGAWHSNPGEADSNAPKISAARLDFAAKDGVTLMFWLRPDADNPRDAALLSSANHLGSTADVTYGRGREL